MFKLSNISRMISRDQLSRIFNLCWYMTFKEIDESHSLLLLSEIEIHTISKSHYIQTIRMSIVFQ